MLLTLRIIFFVRFKGRNVYCPNFHVHLFCLFLKDAKRSNKTKKNKQATTTKAAATTSTTKTVIMELFKKKKPFL